MNITQPRARLAGVRAQWNSQKWCSNAAVALMLIFAASFAHPVQAATNAPTAASTFSPSLIAVGGSSLLTITLTNDNDDPINGVGFADDYPAPVNVINSGIDTVVSNTCNANINAPPNATYVVATSGTILPHQSCSIAINLVGTVAGSSNNSTGPITSSNAPTGAPYISTLTITNSPLLTAPGVSNVFIPASVSNGGSSALVVHIDNVENIPITGARFSDAYPFGIANVSDGPVIAADSCLGTVSADPGASGFSLVDGVVPAGSGCDVVINVLAMAPGIDVVNSTTTVLSGNAHPGNAATGTLTITNAPPLFEPVATIEFLPSDIVVGGTSQMHLAISNFNGSSINELGLTAHYIAPVHMTNASSDAIVENTCGGTLVADDNATTISLSGGQIAQDATCDIRVNVTGTSAGVSDVQTSAIASSNARSGSSVTQSLTVADIPLLSAPVVTKTFTPSSVVVGGTAQMTITLLNMNVFGSITGLQFKDVYPSGMANASQDVVVTNTCGGTVTADPDGTSLELVGGTIQAAPACIIQINVVGTTPTPQIENHTGAVSSANALPGTDASGTLVVTDDPLLPAPAISMVFAPDSVVVGGTTALTITLTNPGSTTVTGVQFKDWFPDGMSDSGYGVVFDSCGGTYDEDVNFVSLVNGEIPANGSCQLVVQTTGTAVGTVVNTTTSLTSSNAAPAPGASATLTVGAGALLQAPIVTKSFLPSTVAVGGHSQMALVFANPNMSDAITGVQAFDSYPVGLENASSNVVVSNTCGGTVNADPGVGLAVLVNGSIPPQQECTVLIDVVGTIANTVVDNHTGFVSSGNAVSSADASAQLTVTSAALLPAPTITKTFSPSDIVIGGSSQMTITLSNSSGSPVTGVQVDDIYPNGIVNSSGNPVISDTCNFIKDVPENGAWAKLGNGTIPNSSCSIVITVVGTSTATNNTGSVPSANALSGGSASATLTVGAGVPMPDLMLTKSHAGNFSQGQTGAAYFLIAQNMGGGSTTGTVTVADTLPPSLTATSMGGPGWACTLATKVCTRSDPALPGASYPAITLTVDVAPNASPSVINTATVSGGGEANTANDTASDPTTIDGASAGADLTLTKSHAGNFSQGQIGAVYSLIVHNVGGAASSGIAAVSDVLPASLTATSMSGPGWTCTLATTTCTRGDVLAVGASYPAITLTVNVAANAPASVINTADTSGGGETNINNDMAIDPTTIEVAGAGPDLTLTKNHVGNFSQSQTGAIYSLIAHNVGGASTNGFLTTVADALPASLTATAMSGPGWTCSLATTSCSRSDTLGSGASYPAITLTVSVAANAPPSVINVATVSGGGEVDVANDAASDPTTITAASVAADLTLTKSHAGNFSQGQTGATYSLVAHNVGAAASSGAVVVADTLPSSLTPTAMTGSGWTCTLATTSCTRSDALVNGASYPPITLTVDVAANAPPSVINTATVNGGGETNTANDAASDSTTITQTGSNQAPTATGDAIEVAPNGQSSALVGDPNATDSVLDNDVDPDGDPMTVVKLSDPAHSAQFQLNADGTFTYQTNLAAGSDSFTYKACDTHNACSPPTTVTITIGNGLDNHVPFAVNDAIQVASAGTTGALVGDPNTADSVLDNDTDPDADTLTATKLTNPAHGQLVQFNADGTFSYQNNGDAATSDSFLYEACDTHGACALAEVTITIGNGPADHLPIVVDDAIQVQPGSATSALIGDLTLPNSVLDNDTDPDGDLLTAGKASPLLNSSGSLTFLHDGTFTYQNDIASQATSDMFFYEACDNFGACTPGVVSITITNNPLDHLPVAVNDAIAVAPNSSTSMLVGGAASVLANDHDADPGETATLKAHLISAPANGHVTLNANGTFTYFNDIAAADSFKYEACDTEGACAAATVAVTIDATAPTVTCILPRQVDVVGDTVSLDLSLLFAPPLGQQSLNYSGSNLPPSLSIAGSILSGTLQASDVPPAPPYAYASTLTATALQNGAAASENVIFQVLPTGEILLRDGFDGGQVMQQPCQ